MLSLFSFLQSFYWVCISPIMLLICKISFSIKFLLQTLSYKIASYSFFSWLFKDTRCSFLTFPCIFLCCHWGELLLKYVYCDLCLHIKTLDECLGSLRLFTVKRDIVTGGLKSWLSLGGASDSSVSVLLWTVNFTVDWFGQNPGLSVGRFPNTCL